MRSSPTVAPVRRILLLPALLLLGALPVRAQTVSTWATGLNFVRSLAVDASGNIYCSQRMPYGKIDKFTAPAFTVSTFANGIPDPIDMTFDDAGNMFVANYSDGKIYKITSAGVKSVFIDTPYTLAALTRDAAGNLYAGDYYQQKVIRITAAGDTSTYAPAFGDAGDRLVGFHMDPDGTLYVGLIRGRIYTVPPGGGAAALFCSGMSEEGGSFDRGPDGNFYTPDYGYNSIWKVTPAGVVSLWSGNNSLTAAYVDGPIGVARFNHPTGTLTIGGRLYVADYQNNVIRVIDGIPLTGPTPAANTTWGRIKSLYR